MHFKDRYLEDFWRDPSTANSKRIPSKIMKPLYRKLQMLEAAAQLNDLRVPPGNRLEPLKGNRKGQYSIRVNDQWRLCFRWTDYGAEGVELCDYHS